MIVLLVLMAGVIALRIGAIAYARQVARHLLQADAIVRRALDSQHAITRIWLRELADDPLTADALADPTMVSELEAEMGTGLADSPAALVYLADETGRVIACFAEQPCSGESAGVITDISAQLAMRPPDNPAAGGVFIATSQFGPALISRVPIPASGPDEEPTGAALVAEIPIEEIVASTAEETRTHVLIYNGPAAPVVSQSSPEMRSLPSNQPVLLPGTYQQALQFNQPGVMRVSDVTGVHIGARRYHAVFMPLTLEDQPRGVLGLLIPNPTFIPLRVIASDSIFFVLMAMLLSGAIVGGALISTSLVQPVLSRVETENARMMSILGSVADGVVLRNPEGHIILANPAAVDLLSTPDGFYPEALEGLGAGAGADPGPIRIEIGRRTVSVSIAAVRTADGDHLGDVLVLRDVTQEAIVERTKDSFIAQISHELRTPLTVIRGYVDVLRYGESELSRAAHKRAIDALHEQTNTLSRMVNESIELARLKDGGSIPIDPSPVELKAFVSTAIAAWQADLTEAGLKPHTDWVNPSPIVAIDVHRMRRAFDALLHNACRFSPDGGDLHVRTTRQGAEAFIHITDPGVGISPEDMPRIFELFYRGDPVRQDDRLIDLRGFGQGLYIVKSIVEAHGGRIEVESNPGEGSTFTVILPVLASGD